VLVTLCRNVKDLDLTTHPFHSRQTFMRVQADSWLKCPVELFIHRILKRLVCLLMTGQFWFVVNSNSLRYCYVLLKWSLKLLLWNVLLSPLIRGSVKANLKEFFW